MEQRDVEASETLRAALSKVESRGPDGGGGEGFSYDLVLGLVRKGQQQGQGQGQTAAATAAPDVNESLLRLQGTGLESGEITKKESFVL